MHIRKMGLQDIEQVYAISCECFTQPWTEEAIRKEMSNPIASYFVAEEGESLLGYGGMWHIADESEIINIAVTKASRKQKIGSLLLQALLEEAKEKKIVSVFLEVRESNCAAQGLYGQFGFKEISRRKGYYHEPTEDAINMTCILE